MRSHAIALALAAGLMFGGAINAAERSPIATGSTSSAGSSADRNTGSALDGVTSVRSGFGFSPFLEEGLAPEVPPARHHELRTPAPAYLGEFGRLADP